MVKLFVFDLDGTLWDKEAVFPYMVDFVRAVQKIYKVVFLTNNSSKSRTYIYKKLNRLGYKCKLKDVYTSKYFVQEYIRENHIRDAIIVNYDPTRTKPKVIVCNMDKPGCGDMVKFIGKPETYMLDKISKKHKVSPKEIIVYGDSDCDMEMAKRFGSTAIRMEESWTKEK